MGATILVGSTAVVEKQCAVCEWICVAQHDLEQGVWRPAAAQKRAHSAIVAWVLTAAQSGSAQHVKAYGCDTCNVADDTRCAAE